METTNVMKTLLTILISFFVVVSGHSQTRNVLVGTNSVVVQPTNFWSADATNARSGLGLGSAATNPASAFQPSSTILSNLSLGNGSGLTNVTANSISSQLAISNTAGLQAALDGKLSTNGSASDLTNFPTIVLQTNSSLSLFPEGILRTNGNAFGLTNFPVIPVTSGGTGGTNGATARSGIGLGTTNTLTIAGVVAQNITIESGGGITLQSALTNAASFRTNIGLSWTGLTNVDASSFRSALGLSSAATNPSSVFQPSSSVLSNLATANGGSLTNIQAANIVGTIASSNIPSVTFTNISGTLTIAQGGTSATNASNARQNLGSTTVGDAVFIATNAEAARTAINALAPNGSAANLTNFPAILLRTNGDGSGITNISGANVVGAVSSASNIVGSIAISNVSNLQTALDGKLGTNPTLFIANISNLQTTLDGKLGINPTLQISNIAALQTALDGKLSGTFPIAISNVSGLQTSLDGKLATNPTLAIANISGLQTNLDSKLSITGNAVNLTNFPTLNQNTTGTASNVTGVVAIANGGTGTNSASGARQNLGLTWTGITNSTAESFKSALGLGWSALTNTNAATSLLGFTTNGQVVANTGTNTLTFTNEVKFASGDIVIGASSIYWIGSGAGINFEEARFILDNTNAYWTFNTPFTFGNTTNAAVTRANLGFNTNVNTLWTATNASNARSAVGLGWSALTNTNAATSLLGFTTNGQVVANTGTNVLTFTNNAINIKSIADTGVTVFDVINSTFYTGVTFTENVELEKPLSFFGTNATGAAATTRANLGFDTNLNTLWTATNASNARSAMGLGATWLTNTNVTNFRTAIGLGTNDDPVFNGATITGDLFAGSLEVAVGSNSVSVSSEGIVFTGVAATTTRTNLGLGWSALTNTNAGTSLVSVNTNGDVVSPTNFWQRAPIQTFVQDFTVIVTTQTNNATNTRNLYVYSLATNVTGISNIIVLPTNSATFNGDEATIIHRGTTNTTTVVRQDGSTNNLITLNRFDESVKFIRELGQWDFYHNISFVEPIQFSGTNVSANIATTRTNLGLGLPALTNTNAAGFQRAIFTTNAAPTNSANVNTVNFNTAVAWIEISVVTNSVTNSYRIPVFQ